MMKYSSYPHIAHRVVRDTEIDKIQPSKCYQEERVGIVGAQTWGDLGGFLRGRVVKSGHLDG